MNHNSYTVPAELSLNMLGASWTSSVRSYQACAHHKLYSTSFTSPFAGVWEPPVDNTGGLTYFQKLPASLAWKDEVENCHPYFHIWSY